MSILIVGADRIGSFLPKLKALGAEEILHWSGRKAKACKKVIPARTDLVIFCTDFLQHKVANELKKQVKERRLPAVYCRRAWSEIAPELEQHLGATEKAGLCRGESKDCAACPHQKQRRLN